MKKLTRLDVENYFKSIEKDFKEVTSNKDAEFGFGDLSNEIIRAGTICRDYFEEGFSSKVIDNIINNYNEDNNSFEEFKSNVDKAFKKAKARMNRVLRVFDDYYAYLDEKQNNDKLGRDWIKHENGERKFFAYEYK